MIAALLFIFLHQLYLHSFETDSLGEDVYYAQICSKGIGLLCLGPAPAGVGPNARPRRGAPLSSGVITSLCSVNRAMTFLMKKFLRNTSMNIKKRQSI